MAEPHTSHEQMPTGALRVVPRQTETVAFQLSSAEQDVVGNAARFVATYRPDLQVRADRHTGLYVAGRNVHVGEWIVFDGPAWHVIGDDDFRRLYVPAGPADW